MPETKWPDKRRLIGTKVSRVDGRDKATGLAKYSQDFNPKGLCHALMLRSPHAHCRIKSLDTKPAEKIPGFKAVYVVKPANSELFYAGDEILGVAADTEEHAYDCLRAIKIEYDVLDHVVTEEEALKDPKKGTTPNSAEGNVRGAVNRAVGNVEDAFKSADAVVEGVYGQSVQTHVCLETHGLIAEWNGDDLTVWASTQAVPGTANDLRAHFGARGIAATVKCITHHMGAGYGSKFGADIQGRVAAELARAAKAPVKLFLDRADEHTAGGNRPSATSKIKIAGTKDGKITAFSGSSYGTGGNNRGPDALHNLTPYVYAVPNIKNEHKAVYINAGGARAMRAPGHPQACFLTESALDDLCNKLGLDPLLVRRKNLADDFKKPIYEKGLDLAAQLSDWAKKWHPPGKGGDGPIKHGIGLALHTWGGRGNQNNDVKVTVGSDGRVLAECSTQDLGTGERTVLAIVIAEALGLEVKDIDVRIGESQFGRSTGSGGSTTCPGTSPAALNAAADARKKLFDKIADRLGQKPEDLSIDPAKPGKIVGKDKEWSWKEACAKLGMDRIQGTGDWSPGLSSQGVGGVQVAEVKVDTETGVVRCTKIVAVQDCGMIINKLGCESQVAGGVIMGLNYALFEDRIMDRHTGRQVNPDMEFYKLGGIQDMPEIVVHMHDMPERGVIGIGEPPTIGTAAAIGNAICNAIGARVSTTPFTPDKVLLALAPNKV